MQIKPVINVVKIDKPQQTYVSDYILADGKKVARPNSVDMIDFEPLRSSVGQIFEMHINGVYYQDVRLTGIIEVAGIPAIQYDELGMDADDIAAEEESDRLWEESLRDDK